MKDLVTVIKYDEISFVPMGAHGEFSEIASVIHPISTTMGGGLCRLRKCVCDWSLSYDEIIYVASGSMFIAYDGVKNYGKKWDIFFIKKGASITYGTEDEAEFFFAVYPGNWRELENKGEV